MTTLAEKIAIMQAYTDGKAVQYYNISKNVWKDAVSPTWDWFTYEYRVKPAKPNQVTSYCFITPDGNLFWNNQKDNQTIYKRFPAGDITGVVSE